MTTNAMYKFITAGPSGKTREWESVKLAFDHKDRNEDVYLIVVATESRYKVLRP